MHTQLVLTGDITFTLPLYSHFVGRPSTQVMQDSHQERRQHCHYIHHLLLAADTVLIAQVLVVHQSIFTVTHEGHHHSHPFWYFYIRFCTWCNSISIAV